MRPFYTVRAARPLAIAGIGCFAVACGSSSNGASADAGNASHDGGSPTGDGTGLSEGGQGTSDSAGPLDAEAGTLDGAGPSDGAQGPFDGPPGTFDGAGPSDGAQGPFDGAGTSDSGSGDTSVTDTCTPSMKFGGGEHTTSSAMVTAKVVDETGAPISGQPVFVCGINVCSPPSTTDGNGAVTISTTLAQKKVAFTVGDKVNYGEIAIPLTASTTDFTRGGTAVLMLGHLSNKPGAALTPGTSATSGDVTVAVPQTATVGIDTLTYATSDQQKLRTVRVPLTDDAPVLASSGVTGFELLYALAPAETPVCPPATVTVQLPHATMTPNDLGWTPGTVVEFWIMTTDTGQIYAPYAGWAKASDGVVSADGSSVSTVDGQGFALLEMFAIRKP